MNAARISELAPARLDPESSLTDLEPYWCALMVDHDLVARAATHIRSVCAQSAGRLDEIGTYLLRAFCNNNSRVYYETCPDGHRSLLALMAKCGTAELPMSAAFLRRAVAIAALAHEMDSVCASIQNTTSDSETKPPRRLQLVRHRRAAPEPPPLAQKVVGPSVSMILRIA